MFVMTVMRLGPGGGRVVDWSARESTACRKAPWPGLNPEARTPSRRSRRVQVHALQALAGGAADVARVGGGLRQR
jgi:hypothetical protein